MVELDYTETLTRLRTRDNCRDAVFLYHAARHP